MRRSQHHRRRPSFDRLESRSVPVAGLGFGFSSAFGLGVSGTFTDLRADAVAEDASGNLVVVGSFRGTVDFDPGPGTTNLTNGGNRDAFVAKFGPTGTLLWAETFRGTSSASVGEAAAVSIDASGSIFVAGSFSGSVDFDASAGSDVLSAPFRTDVFVLRLNANGGLIWATSTTGAANMLDEAFAVAADGSGGAAIAGSYQGTAKFGFTTLNSGGQSDAFAATINASGQFTWARSTTGSGATTAEIHGLAIDGNGRLVMAGLVSGSVNFDPGAGSTVLTSNGSRDIAVWVLDGSGNLAWARDIGGTDVDQADAVAVDPSGNVYATGCFSGTVDFDPGLGTTNLTAVGPNDVFVLKLSPTGSLDWARSFAGSTQASRGEGIGVDSQGRVAVGGWFGGTVDFDPGPGTAAITSAGSTDIFVASLDLAGNYLNATSAGGSGSDMVLGLAINASDTLAIAGPYTGPASFSATTLTAQGSINIFAATVTQTVPTNPPPPAPSPPVLDSSSDTGASHSDDITSTRSPLFDTVATDPSFTVQLLRDGVLVGSMASGRAITDPGPVSDGSHSYTTKQVNPAGVVGPSSPALSVIIDTLAPVAPPIPGLLAADDTATLGDGLTSVRQPHLVGSAEPGAAVDIFDAVGNLIGSALAAVDGSYRITPSQPFADGGYALRARATDLAGNVGPLSLAFALTIDSTPPVAPGAPTLSPASDTGTPGDGITSNRQPTLSGTAERNSTVQIVDGSGNLFGSATASATGAYTIVPTAPLLDGTYSLRARAIDAAGNVGLAGPALPMTIDTIAPAAPSALTLLPADDSGLVGDGVTNVNRPRLTGTAEPASTVQLIGPGGSILGTTTATALGNFTIVPTSPLTDGMVSLSARAIDAAGNPGLAGPALVLTIDTTAPAPPMSLALIPGDDSGVVGDGITNVVKPRLTGQSEVSATIQLLGPGGTVLGTATATNQGTFTVAPTTSFGDGPVILSVRAIDAAGNVGLAGSSITITIDTTPPAPPSAPTLLPADDSGTLGDGRTNIAAPRLIGTGEPGTSARLIDSTGKVDGTTTLDASGRYTIAPGVPFPEGVYSLSIALNDAAGNVGAAGPVFTLTIDTTAPLAPSTLALLAADDSGVAGDRITNVKRPRIVGTAEPGATVRLLDSSGHALGSTVATGSGSFTLIPDNPFSDGPIAVRAVATDLAGNVGPASPGLSITIDATPPAPPSLSLLAADDSGVKGDGVTIVRRSHLVGTTDPGATVQVVNGSGTVVATVVVGVDGTFSAVVNPGRAGTSAYRARATDVAGNIGSTGVAMPLTILATPGDFDGDGIADVVTYNPSTAVWTIRSSIDGISRTVTFGQAGVDIPMPADYDGDGKTDIAIFRPSTAQWFIKRSSDGVTAMFSFGQAGVDLPVPGDYDGDGKADIAVYRPTTGQWFVLGSKTGTVTTTAFGWAGHDVPVPADYDGDGKVDIAVYRPTSSDWFVRRSTDGVTTDKVLGLAPTDRPIPADYDGDGKADLAVYRPTTGQWLVLQSTNGATSKSSFGWAGVDVPIPSDFDGDGKADLAVSRPTTSQEYIAPSGGGATLILAVGLAVKDRPALLPMTYRLNGLLLASVGRALQ